MLLAERVHPADEDAAIEQAVRAELNAEGNGTDRRLVRVAVDRGVVHLTGSTSSYAEKCAIERAVARVVGVKDLLDHLMVLPTADGIREDRHIRTAARRALEWDARVPDGVHASVTDAVLRLHGVVDRYWQREAAEEAVRNLVGLRDVVNEIRVARSTSPRPPSDLARDIETALRRRFGPDHRHISVAVAADVVTLRGVVPTYAMLGAIEPTVLSVPGAMRIDNQLLVA